MYHELSFNSSFFFQNITEKHTFIHLSFAKTKKIQCFSLLFFLVTNQLDLQGPVFSHEPPHKIEFSNSTGGHVECSGHGSPPPEVRSHFFKITIVYSSIKFHLPFKTP